MVGSLKTVKLALKLLRNSKVSSWQVMFLRAMKSPQPKEVHRAVTSSSNPIRCNVYVSINFVATNGRWHISLYLSKCSIPPNSHSKGICGGDGGGGVGGEGVLTRFGRPRRDGPVAIVLLLGPMLQSIKTQ